MTMREFYDEWTQAEIDNYLRTCPVLVLFKIHRASKTAELIIHGRLTESQRFSLKSAITSMFGGNPLSKGACDRINEFSEKWYNKNIKGVKARVINIRRKVVG